MKDMSLELFKVQFLMFWFFTFILVLVLDRIALYKLGAKSEAWKNLRYAKSFSLTLLTIPAVVVGVLYILGSLTALSDARWSSLIVLPYFITTAYFPTMVFRELKRKREMTRYK